MPQECSYEDKIKAINKVVSWLQNKYQLPKVKINVKTVNTPWVLRKGVSGYILQDGVDLNITIATDRDISRCIQTTFHEFCHAKQLVIDKIPYHKLNKKCETEAWVFSANEMNEYIKDVGSNWK